MMAKAAFPRSIGMFFTSINWRNRALANPLAILGFGFYLSLTCFASAKPSTPAPLPYWRGFLKTPVKPVEVFDRPYRTWMLSSTPHPVGIPYASRQGLLVYRCRIHPKDEESLETICFIDFKEATLSERMLRPPKNETKRLRLGGIRNVDGDFVLGLAGEKNNTFRVLHLRTGKQVIVGKIKQAPVDHPVGPFATIEGGRVVWVDEYKDKKTGRRNAVRLFDLQTRKTQTLFEVPPLHEVDQVALEGNRLLYSLVDVKDQLTQGVVDSDIYLYDLTSNQHTQITQTGWASQPSIAWPYLVWKTAIFFPGGGIYVYNAETKEGKEVVTATERTLPSRQYRFPRVSSAGATWIGDDSDRRVVLYHPKTQRQEVLGEKGWVVSLGGSYITWMSDQQNDPACPAPKEKGCLFFSDLSAPSPAKRK